MALLDLFSDYSALTLLLLGLFAFVAGFIDASVGGGDHHDREVWLSTKGDGLNLKKLTSLNRKIKIQMDPK